MKKLFLIIFAFKFFSFHAQVGINTSVPMGILDMRAKESDKKNVKDVKEMGVVLPSTKDVNKVKTPSGEQAIYGTLIYDEKEHCLRYKKSLNWSGCLSEKGSSTGSEDYMKNLVDGRFPVRVKFVNGKPEYSTVIGALGYLNKSDSFLYGAGSNSKQSPVFGEKNGEQISPSAILSDDIISYVLAGASTSGNIYGKNEYMNSMYLTSSGKIYATGNNQYGQLGTGDNLTKKDFVEVDISSVIGKDEKPIKLVGNLYNYALLTDKGNVYTTGWADEGGTGMGNLEKSNVTKFGPVKFNPIKFDSEGQIQKVSAEDQIIKDIFVSSSTSESFTAISTTNKLFTWGLHQLSGLQLVGDNDKSLSKDDVVSAYMLTDVTEAFSGLLKGEERFKKFISDFGFSLALTDSGRVFGVGLKGLFGAENLSPSVYYRNNFTDRPIDITKNITNVNPGKVKILDIAATTSPNARATRNTDITNGLPIAKTGCKYMGKSIGNLFRVYYDVISCKPAIVAVSKDDIYVIGHNEKGRLGNGLKSNELQDSWAKIKKEKTVLEGLQFISVKIDTDKTVVATNEPESGARLFGAGDGSRKDLGGIVNDATSVFKTITY